MCLFFFFAPPTPVITAIFSQMLPLKPCGNEGKRQHVYLLHCIYEMLQLLGSERLSNSHNSVKLGVRSTHISFFFNLSRAEKTDIWRYCNYRSGKKPNRQKNTYGKVSSFTIVPFRRQMFSIQSSFLNVSYLLKFKIKLWHS